MTGKDSEASGTQSPVDLAPFAGVGFGAIPEQHFPFQGQDDQYFPDDVDGVSSDGLNGGAVGELGVAFESAACVAAAAG